MPPSKGAWAVRGRIVLTRSLKFPELTASDYLAPVSEKTPLPRILGAAASLFAFWFWQVVAAWETLISH